MKRYLLFGICLTMMSPLVAAERFLVDFELLKGKSVIESGRLLVTKKSRTWSKGLKRSYLRLACHQNESGKVEKQYSNEDLFSGFTVKHRIVDNNLELIVERSSVKTRLIEIRVVAKNDCKELGPVVTTTRQSYSFPAAGVTKESYRFDEKTTFRVTIKPMKEIQ